MANRIQYRRDTAANWTAANPILALGEPGYETDTKKRKVGDGTTPWASLGYQAPDQKTLDATYTRPRGLSAVFLGDSQTNQGGFVNANDRGWWVWMNALLGQPFASSVNAGINGDTVTGMLARLNTDVIAKSPDWVFIFGGKNDISASRTFAQIQTDYISILDALQANGNPRIAVITDPPDSGNTTAQKAVRDQLNDWLRKLPRTRPQVQVCIDAYSSVTDPSTGNFVAGLAYDIKHPSSSGALWMGQMAAKVMRPLLPIVDTLNAGPDSLNLLGADGNFVGARTSGVVGLAPGWSEYHGGATAPTYSKVTRTDGIQGEWQQAVIPAGEHTVQIFKDITTGFAVGDTVHAISEYQVDALGEAISGGFPNWTMQLSFLDSGGANAGGVYPIVALASSDGRSKAPTGTFVARTPDAVIPAGTVKLRLSFLDFAAATTFRHGRTAIRKA